jgi:uncharacterized protein DUF4240
VTVDLDGFWELIERSARTDDRAGWLTKKLARLPRAEIEDFQIHLDAVRDRVDTWRHWGAAWLVCGRLCSDDGFWYFQGWLIGQGRAVFEQVAADPDALAGVPAVRALAGRPKEDWHEHEWPDWEELDYVAEEAYEEVTGEEETLDDVLEGRRGFVFRASPEPADERFDFGDDAEMTRRYPRLVAMGQPR